MSEGWKVLSEWGTVNRFDKGLIDSHADFTSPQIVSMTGASTTQSSTHSGGTSERAIDGNASPSWSSGSCTHTASEANPWWKVTVPIAEKMQERFFGLFTGETPDRWNWLQPVTDNAMEVQHVA